MVTQGAIPAELVVFDPSAAYPAVPGSIFLQEAMGHQCRRALPGRDALFSSRGTLLRGNLNPDLDRGDGHKLLINQSGAGHVSVKRGATFAQQTSNAETVEENLHG